jgi:hypothetical protein
MKNDEPGSWQQTLQPYCQLADKNAPHILKGKRRVFFEEQRGLTSIALS